MFTYIPVHFLYMLYIYQQFQQSYSHWIKDWVHECVRASVSGCMGHHNTTQQIPKTQHSRCHFFLLKSKHKPSDTGPALTGQPACWLAAFTLIRSVTSATGRQDWLGSSRIRGNRQEVDRLLRLRTAPRFVWGLRPCTTLLAPNKS